MSTGGISPNLLAIVIASFLQATATGVLFSVLPFYGLALGAAAWQVTLLYSAFALGRFVSEPLWGRLSDRIGRRPVLVSTLLMSGVSIAALVLCQSIWAAVAIRLAAGLISGNVSTFQAFIIGESSEHRARNIGYLGASQSIGYVIGPLTVGVLSHGGAGVSAFSVALTSSAAAVALGGLIVALFVRHGAKSAENAQIEKKTALRLDVTLLLVGSISLVSAFSFAGLDGVFGLWAKDRFGWGPTEFGRIIMTYGVISALSQGVLLQRVSRVMEPIRVLRMGFLVVSAGMALLAIASTLPVAAAAILIISVGTGLVLPSIPMMTVRAIPSPEHQGAALGLVQAVSAVAGIAAPAAIGIFYSATGPGMVLGACAVLCFAAMTIPLKITRIRVAGAA